MSENSNGEVVADPVLEEIFLEEATKRGLKYLERFPALRTLNTTRWSTPKTENQQN